MKGHTHATDGVLRAWSNFADDQARGITYALRTDHTGVQLEEVAKNMVSVLPPADGSRLEQALDAIAWYSEAMDTLDPLASVLLSVRVVELVASWLPSTPTWHNAAISYYATRWSLQQLIYEAYHAIHESLRPWTIDAMTPEVIHDALRLLANEIITPGPLGTVTAMDQAILALPKLVDIYPEISPVGRQVRRANASVSAGREAGSRVDAYECRFVMLLDRLQRCRNAIAHGGLLSVEVAATTVEFARHLASAWLLGALGAEVAGTGTVAAFADLQHGAARQLAALWRGDHPADVLFASP